MLIPDGGLREKCIFFVRLSSEFCIVFLQFSLFVVIIVFPLHKKCAVKIERGGEAYVFIARQVRTRHVKGFLSVFLEFDFQF